MKKLLPLVAAGILLVVVWSCMHAAPSARPYKASCSIFYQSLDADSRLLFDRMYEGVLQGKESVEVPPSIGKDEALTLTNNFFNECAELCAFSSGAYSSNPYLPTARILLYYKRGLDEQEQFIKQVRAIASRMKSYQDVFIYVCDSFSYDYVSTDDGRQYAYECLQRGKAVCNGYAQTFAMLCHFAGLPCSYVNGTALPDGRHAWNIVRAGGNYTLVDTTWADGDNGIVNYDWMGLSSEQMGETHLPDAEYNILPRCANTQGRLMPETYGVPPFSFGDMRYTMRSGLNGDVIQHMQERLIELGYLSGAADGVFESRTEAAVEAFQRKNGIHGPEGSVGVATRLTQAAIFSDQAVPSGGKDRLNRYTIQSDPIAIYKRSSDGVRLAGSEGTLTFTLRNMNPTEQIIAFTLRYWWEDAGGNVVHGAYENSFWNVGVTPDEYEEIHMDFPLDAALSKAAILKWNVVEVAYASGEVCVNVDLSPNDPCRIPAYSNPMC